MTLPPTTSGAIVIVSPLLISPSLTVQSSCPVTASTPTAWLSRVTKWIRPSVKVGPRLTVSQQATPCAAGSGFGA